MATGQVGVGYAEKAPAKGDVESASSGHDGEILTTANGARPRLMTRLGLTAESFKRRTLADEHNQLNKTLKKRHLNMIAIGGSIGAGLFVGSGGALARGGPASLLICFGIIGIMIFNVVYALGELAIMYPVSGGFYTYSVRFIDPSWGFAMGWNYVFQWAIILPLELTVAGLTVNYWPSGVSIAVWITIFYVALIVICLFGVLGYAEEEFWVALLKLSTIVIFMIMGIIFLSGGGPAGGEFDEYYGMKNWYDPGAFHNGFLGFCGVFVTAAFSFSGTELVGLAAAESENPQKQLPSAIKQVFWRITLFYILGLFFVGALVRYDNPNLQGNGSLLDVSTSPFVIAANLAGVPRFGDYVNVVILFSVVSIGLSGIYGGSRTLTALAEQGYAPRCFKYIDRAGRPLWSTIAILVCGPIAYIGLAATGVTVFNWLLALSGLAAIFTWGSICLAHIRFRNAWAYHGRSLDDIPFKAAFGTTGSWIGLFFCFIVLLAQFYTAVQSAIDAETISGGFEAWFNSYLALPVVLIFYFIGLVWKRKTWLPLSKIDLDSGRREIDWEMHRAEQARIGAWPKWRQALYKVF